MPANNTVTYDVFVSDPTPQNVTGKQESTVGRVSTALKQAARLFSGLAVLMAAAPSRAQTSEKPTIVLVHGAFNESSSWEGVIRLLQADGYPVIAPANPLRGVKSDSSYLANLLDTIKGPVVLVGHSISGMMITNAATGKSNIKALVFVSALAPDTGETANDLLSKFPGGTSGSALGPPVSLGGGAHDLYVQQEKFPAQFSADVPAAKARIMAVTQRPIVDTAFGEPSALGTRTFRSLRLHSWHSAPAQRRSWRSREHLTSSWSLTRRKQKSSLSRQLRPSAASREPWDPASLKRDSRPHPPYWPNLMR